MSSRAIVGGDILRLVTAGMYDDPLVLYREYIQNAADAVVHRGGGSGTVRIKVDPFASQVTITDDGTGLSPTDAVRCLVPIGNSTKKPDLDRGRRGIGRLSALAFAERVHFTTRSCGSETVTCVSWDGRALREAELARVEAATAISSCTTVRSLANDDWPDRFFQVTIDGIARHAAPTLLNQDAVRSYVGEVCPVPMAPSFPLATDINDFLAAHTEHLVLDVRLDGEEKPITRPFGKAIPITDKYAAAFERLDTRLIPRVDGEDPAGVLWLAHTPYTGSIPRRLGVRGLRARAGNIQIGADDIFSHLFLETRFNGWCVGEVHIVDSRIVPNARRDYFEPDPHLRNLENHIGAIAQEISSRCRGASSHRNRLRNVGVAINRVKRAHDLTTSGYLLAKDAAVLSARVSESALQLKQTLSELGITPSHLGHDDLSFPEDDLKVDGVEEALVMEGVPPDTVATLQSAFGVVANAMPPESALEVIESIIRRLVER